MTQQNNNKLHSILQSQKRTLHLFLSNASTRTPVIVLYVACFGGALHAAVTTYFYLAIGATATDIGQLGFIMSAGALIGSPISGLALDKYGPWIPISVTAGACAWGCLWRGIASSLASLRMGAMLLGIGVNVWTVVLGHLVKSFPASMRSEVMSGFGVQMTVLQLMGKGVFPLTEYGLHRVVGLEDDLARYRIHMGMCTFFCFYGTFALFWDKKNVVERDSNSSNRGSEIDDIVKVKKYQHKHSDVGDSEFLEEGNATISHDMQSNEIELVPTSKNVDSMHTSGIPDRESCESFADNSCNPSSSSILNDPEPLLDREAKPQILISAADDTSNAQTKAQTKKLRITTITLTFALLLQSIATTILTILWPLLAHDRFDLSAHTFGILTFMSSVVSTGAVAAFPIVERLEKVGGRVRCAAWAFGVGSILCGLFCFCSFGGYWDVAGVEMDLIGTNDGDTRMGDQIKANGGRILEHDDDTIQQLHSRKQFLFHAISAMAFQAVLCFLEPSLKSILSLVVNPPSSTSSSSKGSSLGGTVGFMQTLGSLGGMIGNLAGTYMYKLSKDMTINANDELGGRQAIFQGGSLPFVVTAVFMALSSILMWRIEEPTHIVPSKYEPSEEGQAKTTCEGDVESGHPVENAGDDTNSEYLEDSDAERSDSCCISLRETTYDLKLD